MKTRYIHAAACVFIRETGHFAAALNLNTNNVCPTSSPKIKTKISSTAAGS
jgi:hypothetical protein